MDKVKKTFDEWAKNGRSETMEKEHAKTVLQLLHHIPFDKKFAFLDVGCGNGWVIRHITQNPNCKKAVGIDKSKNMIKNAKSKSTSKKQVFISTDIESWKYRGKFDYAFAMESIYYSESIEKALAKVYSLLKKDGVFFCGTDFYKENRSTAKWSKVMNIRMHLLSEAEWKKAFKSVGFKVKTKHIKNTIDAKKWRRDYGTLFIIGSK